MPASLRVEIFPHDIHATIDFYVRILSFEIAKDEREAGYVYLVRDAIRVGAAVKDVSEYPEVMHDVSQRKQFRHWPAGTELVFEVDDLASERGRIVNAYGNESIIEDDIKMQEWGLRDFRLTDPDGYYIRITERYSREM